MQIQNHETKRKRGRPRKKLEDKLSKVLTTDKQKTFLRNRLAGMTKRRAAIQAGYAPSTASIMAKRLTDKLSRNRIFLKEMERQGLTVEAIVGEIKRGMTEAMHPQYPKQPDNFNRRACTDMAVKLYGGYALTKVDVDIDRREMKIEITAETIERIKKAETIEPFDIKVFETPRKSEDGDKDKKRNKPIY